MSDNAMSDNAMWRTVIGSLLACVTLLVVALAALDTYRDCRYIEAGYTLTTVTGYCTPIWTKK